MWWAPGRPVRYHVPRTWLGPFGPVPGPIVVISAGDEGSERRAVDIRTGAVLELGQWTVAGAGNSVFIASGTSLRRLDVTTLPEAGC